MEVSIEPLCEHITWKVKDFFQLPMDIGCYMHSPEIRFLGDSYGMHLYPGGDCMHPDGISTILYLWRQSVIYPGRKVSCKLGFRFINSLGYETDVYMRKNKISFERSKLEEYRSSRVPGGTFTMLCSIEYRRQTSDAEVEREIGPGIGCLSSCWKNANTEMSTQLPLINLKWEIPDFLLLSSEIGHSIDSPEFRFAGDSYHFRIYPNGDVHNNVFEVVRLTFAIPEKRASCSRIGFRWWKSGGECETFNCGRTLTALFSIRLLNSENPSYIYFRDGKFCMICSMYEVESSGSGSPQNEETQTSDTEEEQERLASMGKLQSDYRQLLQKEEQKDVCLVVSGEEFRAHACILRARSPVFESILSQWKVQKKVRVILKDVDRESIPKFLEYLYTGSVRISDDDVFGLYATANHYDVPTLKSECVAHMRRNLSVDSFCDFVTLALRHREEDLLQRSIQFFKENRQRIVLTVKWQKFLEDNSTSANESYFKDLELGEQ